MLTTRPSWIFLFLSGLAVFIVGLAGWYSFLRLAGQVRLDTEARLQAVATLKSAELSDWLAERRADTLTQAGSRLFSAALSRWQHQASQADREALLDMLKRMRQGYGYASAELIDVEGRRLLGDGRNLPSDETRAWVAGEAAHTAGLVFADLHRHDEQDTLQMGFAAPVLDGRGALLAVLFLDIDPADQLDAKIRQWPLPSRTGETLLARREGGDLVYLSRLRHARAGPLTLKRQFDDPDLALARLLRGETSGAGADYRGEPVFYAGRAVPGTPWTILAKEDQAESLRVVTRLATETAAICVLVLTALLLAVRHLWQRQRLQQESEERFRAIADSAPVLIWMAALDKGCTFFNQTWLDFTGRTLAEEHGNGWAEGVHPDDMRRCLDVYTSSFDAKQAFQMEYRRRRHDGEYRWILDNGRPRHDPEGVFSGYIGSCVDITDRVQMQNRLQEANHRLGISDRRLKAMFALSEQASGLQERELLQLGIDEAVRLSDSQIGYLHFVNEDQESIELGVWSQGTLEVCSAVYDNHYPVSQAGIWADTIRLRHPLIHNDYRNLAGRKGCPEGHAHLTSHLGVPVIEDGKVRMMLGVGNKLADYDESDIQQLQLIGNDLWGIVRRRRAEEALALAKEAAEAASLAKSRFLANMSHEIRTPLNGILGLANLMRRNAVDPVQTNQLEKIDASGKHLLGVINDILDISKIEADRLVLEEADFDLADFLRTLLGAYAERVKDKGLSLNVDVAGMPPQLRGDANRLGQALMNYLGNALKFTEQGHIKLTGRVDEETDGDCLVRFEVADTGPGLSAEQQDVVFDAFVQADSSTSRKHGGTGLGLAITRRLAESMGGEAGVQCAQGKGCTFWITVRLRKGSTGPVTAQAAGEPAEAILRRRHAGTRVLLAEDDPINQEVALLLLEEVGLRADLARNGKEALELAGRQAYALILMDMQMPEMDGGEATRRIRMLPEYQKTPILAMTANAFAENRDECLAAGMDDFITKPVDPEFLFKMLLKWLPEPD